jgi:hypothetical protein
VFAPRAKLRNEQALDVWRVSLLVVSLLMLSMLHAANDASSKSPAERGHGVISEASHDGRPCCEPIPAHGADCDAGSHCPVYLPVVPASYAIEDDSDRFTMPTGAIPVRKRPAGPFRPPRSL